jgi:hypothetical protein
MLMADTMAIFFIILGFMLAFPGLWLLCRGLWPAMVNQAAARSNHGLWISFLVGLPPTAIVAFGVAILFNLGPVAKVLAIALFCVYMVYAHTGVAGLATSVGQRLASRVDEEQPWRATLRGGIVLELTYLLPILGWFVILPVSIVVGCGAATRSIFKLNRALSTGPTSPALGGPQIDAHADGAVLHVGARQ